MPRAPGGQRAELSLALLALLSRVAVLSLAVVADTVLPDHQASDVERFPHAETLGVGLKTFTR